MQKQTCRKAISLHDLAFLGEKMDVEGNDRGIDMGGGDEGVPRDGKEAFGFRGEGQQHGEGRIFLGSDGGQQALGGFFLNHEYHAFRLFLAEEAPFKNPRGDVVRQIPDDAVIRGIIPFDGVSVHRVKVWYVFEIVFDFREHSFVDVDEVAFARERGQGIGKRARAASDFEHTLPFFGFQSFRDAAADFRFDQKVLADFFLGHELQRSDVFIEFGFTDHRALPPRCLLSRCTRRSCA